MVEGKQWGNCVTIYYDGDGMHIERKIKIGMNSGKKRVNRENAIVPHTLPGRIVDEAYCYNNNLFIYFHAHMSSRSTCLVLLK